MGDNSKLFEKYTLNNKVEVPGLLAVAPLTLFGSNQDGSVSEEEREYLKLRATNIGLYILGATAVSQEGIKFFTQPRALSDKDIPANEERVKIIKAQGALAINQIHHGGCYADKKISGVPVMAVSAEVANKELEALLMISHELLKFLLRLDMMELKFMELIISSYNNFIQDIIIKELMIGVAH